MRRGPIQIVTQNCPRCGRPVAGVSRSIHGADAAHARFSGICERCVTDEERQEIENAIVGAILNRQPKQS